ncbi:MAG: OmpH family outer membrane protein [Chitinophagaceae bacterium]
MKLFVIAAFILLSAGSAMAQKTGYIRLEDVVSLMPEVGKIDTMLQKYQTDSLNSQFTYLVSEYNRKDSIANGKDSARTPLATRNLIRQELEGYAYQIQNWQQIAQNQMQGKQSQLLEPVYRKAMNALNQVAKENGYTYVYTKDALLVAPPGDDLLPLVAKKLNIKVPTTNAAAVTPPKK